jgi:nitrite reductase/ring-hydroxylating ferredoxin subunit/uncharacterized membrane protein
MALFDPIVERIGQITALDAVGNKVSEAVSRVTHQPPVSSLVSGTWLGHPLHPALTDLPIGSWTSAFVLDFVGGKASRRAAQALVGLGVLTALPTAAAGIADWADTGGEAKRIGAVHALTNSVGLGLYYLSWKSRRRGHHARGVMWALAGATAATVGATLGGHLVYRLGLGVDVNAPEEGPQEWTTAEQSEEVKGIDGRYLGAGRTKVLATHDATGWHGIGARCSHRGGPLQQGEFVDGCVVCPWHHSRFRLDDGSIVDGPATAPQPQYEVREQAGTYSVRRA